MPENPDIDRDLSRLEADLRRLEAEYNMFFAGRAPRPPTETRRRVEQLVRRLDQTAITNYADRFRFSSLQSRFVKSQELWDRGIRAREEGRPGPFGANRPAAKQKEPTEPKPAEPDDQVLHVASFTDPASEPVKLRQLYDRLVEARRQLGEQTVPFDRFVFTVAEQVRDLKEQGAPEVAFRVGMKDGKVTLTAKGMRGNQS